MTDVHEWYESNKLVINTSKSNVMLPRGYAVQCTCKDINTGIYTNSASIVVKRIKHDRNIKAYKSVFNIIAYINIFTWTS